MIAKNDKVVCIVNFKPTSQHRCPNGMPVKDSIYNVDRLRVDSDGVIGLVITGHPSISFLGNDVGYGSECFRKVRDVQVENELKRLKKETV